jgi:hypothetical protein
MTDLRVCTLGVGFAAVAALSTTALGQPTPLQGGENAGDAVPIPQNVAVSGTTVGYLDDSDEVCPYTGSLSPDVYYSYTGTGNYNLQLSLCNSGYDTKVYVYDGSLALVNLRDGSGPACNDDACTSSGGGAFRSFLSCVPNAGDAAGGILYIVVDGYGSLSGNYTITVSKQDSADCEPPGPCLVECPPGSGMEPDDCDFGNPAPNDTVNGGCNATPNSFTAIACNETVCGTSYFDGSFRDTDWWELDTTSDGTSSTFNIGGQAEFASVYGRVDNGGGSLDCSQVSAFAEFVVSPECTDIDLDTVRLDPGLYWFFVGPDFTQIVDCNQPAGGPPNEVGDHYYLTITCTPNGLPCPWDLDGDMQVGFADLLKVLSFWGPCP